MHNKKSQGISMNTIIIAAIALLVLVILAVIFTQRMGWWSRSSQDCDKFDGDCSKTTCDTGYIEHPTAVCDKQEYGAKAKCCVLLSVAEKGK